MIVSANASATTLPSRPPPSSAILCALAAVSLILIALTALMAINPNYPILSYFNLSTEHTVGTWWSSMQLLLAAVLFFSARYPNMHQSIAGWVSAALLAGLSLDEMGSIHERVSVNENWLNLLPFGLIVIAMFGYSILRWLQNPATRPSAILLGLGFICFASTAFQEYLEHTVNWPEWTMALRVGVEEGIELLGSILCVAAALRLHVIDYPKDESEFFLHGKIPYLFPLATFGLFLQLIASFIAPNLSGYPNAGNPAMWFPSACYAIAGMLIIMEMWRSNRITMLPTAMLAIMALLSFLQNYYYFPYTDPIKLVILNVIGLSISILLLAGYGASLANIARASIPAVLGLLWFAIDAHPTSAFMAAGCCGYVFLCLYHNESEKRYKASVI